MIFATQGLLTLRFNTGIELTGATSTKIKYHKPDATVGELDASIVDEKYLEVDVDNATFDQVGVWKFQTVVTMGGLNGYGDIVEITFTQKL